jgi:hypothetical protein
LIITVLWSVIALIGVGLQSILVLEAGRDLKTATEDKADKAMQLVSKNNLRQEQIGLLMQSFNLGLGLVSLAFLLFVHAARGDFIFTAYSWAIVFGLLSVEVMLLVSGFANYLLRQRLK